MTMLARFQPRWRARRVVARGTALLALLGAGCATRAPYDQVTRWTMPAAARPSSSFPAYKLRRHGDLGAGTLARGGEMLLDGLYYYQCAPDGAVEPLQPSEPLCAGWAVRFRPDLVEVLEPGCTLARIEALLAVDVPDRSMPCAFRLVGRFTSIQLASGKMLQRVSGSLFGVRLPREGRDDAATDLYFLSGDWLTGGRVGAFSLIDGSLAIDLCPRHLQIHAAAGQALGHLRR